MKVSAAVVILSGFVIATTACRPAEQQEPVAEQASAAEQAEGAAQDAQESQSDAEISTSTKIICRGGESYKGEIICHPERQEEEELCAQKFSVLNQIHSVNSCIANCQACTIPAANIAAFDVALDEACDTECAKCSTCPPEQRCTGDQVTNKTNIPFCIAGSTICTLGAPNPAATPDLCLKIERIGECTCICARDF